MKPAFQHITVPVDGSTASERGVAFALELARGGGVVTFCSVVDPMLVCAPAGYGVALDPGPMLQTLDDDAAEFCRRARSEAAAAGIAADARVLHGQCVETIDTLVRSGGAQAIVVGTHGRTGVARGILGSVAEGLLRRSDVPVIAVHEDDAVGTGPVAVALDDSPAAQAALETAILIAAAREAPVVLIHARETRSEDPGRANALLLGATERIRARGVKADVVVRDGRAGDALIAAAHERGCSMIVMGTHGRPFFERLVLGSVAAHVVEHAHVPVVTVRRTTAA
jgi:nucleotide-binding universal stress UspA family protein